MRGYTDFGPHRGHPRFSLPFKSCPEPADNNKYLKKDMDMMNRTLLALVIVSAGCATVRQPLPDLVSDRPDATESAVAIPAGHIQIETGYTFTRQGTDHAHTVGEVLARIGLFAGVELRLDLSSVAIDAPADRPARSGVNDPAIGAKVELPATRLFPETALLFMTGVPIGTSGFGEGAWRPVLLVASAWSLGSGVDGGVNLGWSSNEGNGEAIGSAAVGFGLAPRWGAFVETFGSIDSGNARRGFLNGGVTYELTHNLQFDVRIGSELGGQAERFIGAGIVARW